MTRTPSFTTAEAHKLAVVTVTYNSIPVLEDFLTSVAAQTYPNFELYAIDNASSDGTVKRLGDAAKADSRIVVVANAENLGFAGGTNDGIRRAFANQCSHVLLLNNDTTFPPDLFSKLMGIVLSKKQPGVVVPKIYYHGEPKRIWFGGGRFVPARAYGARHFGEGELDQGQFDIPRRVDYASGCCLLIAEPVFRTVGLLDEKYFVYMEDADFCLRLMRAAVPIWYAPQAHLYHKVSSLTGGKSSAFSARMGARNRAYYLKKHFSPLTSAYFSLLYFAYLIARWMIGQDSWTMFRLRTNAFVEGRKL